jgi:hypothetical protein
MRRLRTQNPGFPFISLQNPLYVVHLLFSRRSTLLQYRDRTNSIILEDSELIFHPFTLEFETYSLLKPN